MPTNETSSVAAALDAIVDQQNRDRMDFQKAGVRAESRRHLEDLLRRAVLCYWPATADSKQLPAWVKGLMAFVDALLEERSAGELLKALEDGPPAPPAGGQALAVAVYRDALDGKRQGILEAGRAVLTDAPLYLAFDDGLRCMGKKLLEVIYPPCPEAPEDETLPGAESGKQPAELVTADLPTVWYHGNRSYSSGEHRPVTVTKEQHNVLKEFLNRDLSLDTNALQKAGVSNVSAVITKLVKQFGEAVRKPKSKGQGYFIRVRTKKPN